MIVFGQFDTRTLAGYGFLAIAIGSAAYFAWEKWRDRSPRKTKLGSAVLDVVDTATDGLGEKVDAVKDRVGDFLEDQRESEFCENSRLIRGISAIAEIVAMKNSIEMDDVKLADLKEALNQTYWETDNEQDFIQHAKLVRGIEMLAVNVTDVGMNDVTVGAVKNLLNENFWSKA